MIAAIAWFEPHKLFIDDKVNEAAPVGLSTSATTALAAPLATPAPTTQSAAPAQTPTPSPIPTPSAPPAAPVSPVVLGSGSFVTHEHATSGKALFIRLPDGTRTLRLEDLKTSNGPDLRVYLSSAAPDAGWHAFGDDYVELGKLKGNIGSQNYDIPANVDLARYSTAVVWCKRFSVSFGAAAVRPT